MEVLQQIRSVFEVAAGVKKSMVADLALQHTTLAIVESMVDAFGRGHKVWFCGNGGSAADAQHLAAELSGRFYIDRAPLPAEALHVNTSYLTAVANDFGYEHIYSRMVTGMGSPGDVLVGISTSGNSANVVAAMQAARQKQLVTVAFLGSQGGQMLSLADYAIQIPSTDTPRIQEGHMLVGHTICQLVEARLFGGQTQIE